VLKTFETKTSSFKYRSVILTYCHDAMLTPWWTRQASRDDEFPVEQTAAVVSGRQSCSG